MENEGIITRVSKPTEWTSSIVLVRKANNDIRICLDPTDLNKAIKRPRYPLPTVNDVLA